jgi:hypothetical protein
MIRFAALMMCVGLFVGCHRSVWKTTGLGEYISGTITNYGGQLKSVAATSLEGLPWIANEDKGGVKLVVRGEYFPVLDRYFQEALGMPRMRSTNNLGYPFVGYHIRDVGMAITYDVRDDVPGYPKGVLIVMLRGATNSSNVKPKQ